MLLRNKGVLDRTTLPLANTEPSVEIVNTLAVVVETPEVMLAMLTLVPVLAAVTNTPVTLPTATTLLEITFPNTLALAVLPMNCVI
jgi:hypothetical protein